MKKITLTLFMAAVAVLCFFGGCQKILMNKYEGTWEFVTIRPSYLKVDTIYYTGTVTGGMYKDEVEIQYTEYNAPFLKVKMSGELYADRGAYKVGQFEGKDKVHLEMGNDVVDGIKISKKW